MLVFAFFHIIATACRWKSFVCSMSRRNRGAEVLFLTSASTCVTGFGVVIWPSPIDIWHIGRLNACQDSNQWGPMNQGTFVADMSNYVEDLPRNLLPTQLSPHPLAKVPCLESYNYSKSSISPTSCSRPIRRYSTSQISPPWPSSCWTEPWTIHSEIRFASGCWFSFSHPQKPSSAVPVSYGHGFVIMYLVHYCLELYIPWANCFSHFLSHSPLQVFYGNTIATGYK